MATYRDQLLTDLMRKTDLTTDNVREMRSEARAYDRIYAYLSAVEDNTGGN